MDLIDNVCPPQVGDGTPSDKAYNCKNSYNDDYHFFTPFHYVKYLSQS